MQINGGYQVTLWRNTDKDEVISNPDLLSFRPLLGGRVDGPPAGLPCDRVIVQKAEMGKCTK